MTFQVTETQVNRAIMLGFMLAWPRVRLCLVFTVGARGWSVIGFVSPVGFGFLRDSSLCCLHSAAVLDTSHCFYAEAPWCGGTWRGSGSIL